MLHIEMLVYLCESSSIGTPFGVQVSIPETDGRPSEQAAVGWRINFWWAGTREWVEGEVLAHREADGRHHVVFADGEDEWLHLDRECIRWLGNTKQRGSQLRPIAFGLDSGQLAPKGRDAVKWRVGLHSNSLGRFVRAEIAEFDSATGRHRVSYLQDDAAAGERTWISLTASKITWRFPPGHLAADSEAATPAGSQAAGDSSAATADRVVGVQVEAVSSGVGTGVKREKTPGPTSRAKRRRIGKNGKTSVAVPVTSSATDLKKAADTTKKVAETVKKAAETTKKSAEMSKKAAEMSKKAAEMSKKAAETSKKAGVTEKKQSKEREKEKEKEKDKDGACVSSGMPSNAKKSSSSMAGDPVTPASVRPGKAGCTRSATSQSPEKQAAVSVAVAFAISGSPKAPQPTPPPVASTGDSKEVVVAEKPGRRHTAPVPQPSPPRPSAGEGKNEHRNKDVGSAGDKSTPHGGGQKRDRKMFAPAPRATLATAAALKSSHVQREAAARARRPTYMEAFTAEDNSSEDTYMYRSAVDDIPELESSLFSQRFYAESFTRTTRDLQRSTSDFGSDAALLLTATEARAAFIQQALRALEQQPSSWVPCKPQCTAATAAATAMANTAAASIPASLITPRPAACAAVPPLRAALLPPPPRLAPDSAAAADAARLASSATATFECKAQGVPRVFAGLSVLPSAPSRPLPVCPQLSQSGLGRPALPRAPPPPLRPHGTMAARPMIALLPSTNPPASSARPAAVPRPPSVASAAEGTCPAHSSASAKASTPQHNGKSVKRASTPTNGVRDVAQLLSSAGKSTKLGQKAHRVSFGGSASPPSMRGKPVQNGRTSASGGPPVLQHIILDKTAALYRHQAALKGSVVARPSVARRLSSDNGMLPSSAAPPGAGAQPSAATRPWSSPHLVSPLGLKGGSASTGSGSRAAG
jgi:hypothetical protein